MFKEFGLIFLVFIIIIVIFRRVLHRSSILFGKMCIGIIIGTTLVNILYNFRMVYPTFVYEGVPIGDSEKNLFVYKEDSQFRWHMLNTISSNRTVYLDNEGELYEQYFNIFSDGVKYASFSDEVRRSVIEQKRNFEDFGEMFMLIDLDFAFPTWEGGPRPQLYINTEKMEGCDKLVAVADWGDKQGALYVMSEYYFQSIMEQEELP